MGTSHRGCIMRKVVGKEVTAGGRFDFLLDSALRYFVPVKSVVKTAQKE